MFIIMNFHYNNSKINIIELCVDSTKVLHFNFVILWQLGIRLVYTSQGKSKSVMDHGTDTAKLGA